MNIFNVGSPEARATQVQQKSSSGTGKQQRSRRYNPILDDIERMIALKSTVSGKQGNSEFNLKHCYI